MENGETPDRRFRLGINLRSGLGHCYNCDWRSGRAILDLVHWLGISGETYRPPKREKPPKVEPLRLPEGFELLADCDADDPVYGEALKYCLTRGITERQLREKEIGATVLDREFGYRIVFPIRDHTGKLRGLVGRDWTGEQSKKYWNKIGQAKAVFNARPDMYSTKLGILSEGIFKALAIERASHYRICSMGLNGSTITDEQILQLRGFKELALFPDPGRAGVKGFLGVAQSLSTLFRVTMAYPWPDRQADEMSVRKIRALLRDRRPYSIALEWRFRRELL